MWSGIQLRDRFKTILIDLQRYSLVDCGDGHNDFARTVFASNSAFEAGERTGSHPNLHTIFDYRVRLNFRHLGQAPPDCFDLSRRDRDGPPIRRHYADHPRSAEYGHSLREKYSGEYISWEERYLKPDFAVLPLALHEIHRTKNLDAFPGQLFHHGSFMPWERVSGVPAETIGKGVIRLRAQEILSPLYQLLDKASPR